jgi:hypothetical protein
LALALEHLRQIMEGQVRTVVRVGAGAIDRGWNGHDIEM